MIGNKKIEEAARLDDKEYYDRLSDNDKCFFEYGFRRGYNRALKGLVHPASEVPRNDNGRIFAFSKVSDYRKLYNMDDMMYDGAYVNGVLLNDLDKKSIEIKVEGSVDSINSTSGDVSVNGYVNSVSTASGDVHCKDVKGNVHTMSGNVTCGDITGSVSTMSGNVYRK